MNSADTLNRLADIDLPAAPDWQPWIIAAAMIVLVLALVVAGWYVRHHRARGLASTMIARSAMAQQRVEQVRAGWLSGTISDREAAYRLATLLRLGLGLPQLTPDRPPVAAEQSVWRETIHLFEQLRYQPTARQSLSPEVFQRVEHWLAGRSEIS